MKPRLGGCFRKTPLRPKISWSFTTQWRSRYQTTDAQVNHTIKTFVPNVDSTNVIAASVRSTDPLNFWKNVTHQKLYLDWLAKKKGIQTMEDWYSIRTDEISELHGKTVLKNHSNNLQSLLQTIYPDYKWKWWKFCHVPASTWKDPNRLREYFGGFAEEHNITQPEDWFKFCQKDFKHSNVFKQYKGLHVALGIAYPELASFFMEQRWTWRVPGNYWKDAKNVREFCEFFMQKVGMESMEEWYLVTVDQLLRLGAGGLLRHYGTLPQVVSVAYPEYGWDKTRFEISTKGKDQLYIMAKKLFPNSDVISNVLMKSILPETDGSFRNKPRYDVYIPEHKLVLMYLSRMHYGYSVYQGKPALKQQRFQEKLERSESHGVTVLSIPYWWDHCKDTLQATIYKYRPDIISWVDAEPIPEEPQEDIPGSPVDRMNELHTSGWYVLLLLCNVGRLVPLRSDSLKAFWDGSTTFYLDEGGSIQPPKEFASRMPNLVTEGELSVQPNSKGVSVIDWSNIQWDKITFRAFDTVQKSPLPYGTRLHNLKEASHNIIINEGSYANSVEALLQLAAESDDDQFLIRPKYLLGFPGSHTIYQNWPVTKATVLQSDSKTITCRIGTSQTVKVRSRLQPEAGAQVLLRTDAGLPPVLIQIRKGVPEVPATLVSHFVLTPEFVFSPVRDLTCRHCHKSIGEDIKVEIRAVVQPEDSGPVPHREYTCSNRECLKQATQKGDSYPESRVFLPRFDGALGVTAKGKALLQGNLPNLEGMYSHVPSYLIK